MTLTAELCGRIAATRYETLGAACLRRVKQAIADGVAVAAAGSREEPSALLAAHLRSLGGRPQATAWGHGFRTSTVQAAYVNGVSTHVLDFEPMWLPPTHSVSPTVPVAFALAEAQGLPGREIVAAVAKGMEIQGRIQFAASQYEPEKLRFHPPGIVGVLGAAVTASHLLGLDEAQLAHALGLAASRAGALLVNIGSMTKSTHCGHAAAAGLDAALLAARGFTANPDALAAPRGYIETYFADAFDRAKLLAYGEPFRVVDPGLAIKLFPSQFATHWAITAALDLHPQIGDAGRVARVVIRAPVMRYIDRPRPATGLDGKFSFQYTAAAALLDGAVNIDSFTDARRFRSDIVALLGKTELVQDETIPAEWRGMEVTVTVELRDGARHAATCRHPRGSWGAPELEADAHAIKLRDCLGRLLDRRAANRLLALLDDIEDQPPRGVAAIAALLAGRKLAQQAPAGARRRIIRKGVSGGKS